MDTAGKKLYRKLAEDAHWVSNRERKYAKQARSEKEFAVEFDGEVITTNCAEFSVIPELIKVCTN